MKFLIRAIVLDIDGTITHPNRQLSTTAVKAVRKAENSNVSTCLATGNILCFVQTTATLLGTTGPLIAEDGGIVYDPKTGEENTLSGIEKVEKGIELLEKKFENIKRTKSFDIRRAGKTIERTINPDEIRKVFEENQLDLTVVDSKYALHIKECGTDKGNALEKVSSILDLPLSEIAAMGDGKNDVEMLEKVGISFAPANADKEAKKVCSHVTKGSDGTGVKEAIDQILKGRNPNNQPSL